VGALPRLRRENERLMVELRKAETIIDGPGFRRRHRAPRDRLRALGQEL